MDTVGMFEETFLDSREDTGGHYASFSCARCPARDADFEFCDERRFRVAPIGLVCEIHFTCSGNLAFQSILEKSLPCYVVLISDIEPVIHRFQTGVGDSDGTLEGSGFREFEVGRALHSRLGTLRES